MCEGSGVFCVPVLSLPLQHSIPRYLCAACTCGQAISTVLVREDETSPAEARPVVGDSKRASNAKKSIALTGATARQFEPWECAKMGESGQRKLGEKVRMGLEINAIKEIEELKSEIRSENSAGGDVSNGGHPI